MNRQLRLISVVFALSMICAVRASAQWIDKKLLASDGVGGDTFGWSADLWGDYAAIGAPYHVPNGAVYIFKRNAYGQWLETQKITPPSNAGRFGIEVAISGDFLAVLTYENDAYPKGAVFLYQRTGLSFAFMTTIEPPDSTADRSDHIDLDGGLLIVSDPRNDHVAVRGGRAHIYRVSNGTWVLDASIAPATLLAEDEFGTGVAISGTLAVVSAEGDDQFVADSGAAYIYERSGNTWVKRDKVKNPNVAGADSFGVAISIGLGGRVAVGAPGDDSVAAGAGATYLYERSGNHWPFAGKLTPSDGHTFGEFGSAVGYGSGQVVVGSPHDDGWRGGLYVYEIQNPPTKVVPAGLAPNDAFAHRVATTTHTILASAPWHDANGQDAGAAFILDRYNKWREWDLYLDPWPYIYRYRGCGRTPQDEALTFKLNTARGVTLSFDTLQRPEHGKLVFDKDAQTVTYVPDEGFAGDDSFTLFASDAAGNRNELMVEVLVEAKSR
jgi:hypothetical protein